MMIQQSIKWSLLLLVGGITSCSMLDDNSRYDTMHESTVYEQQAPMKHAKETKAAVKASSNSASKGPMQKSTPGPKRAAAPQIPVF
jgi:hypothetical protein